MEHVGAEPHPQGEQCVVPAALSVGRQLLRFARQASVGGSNEPLQFESRWVYWGLVCGGGQATDGARTASWQVEI